jgi:DNA modification methylase
MRINADCYEYIKTVEDKYFDVLITDAPYDKPFLIDEFRRVTKGHIITFCAENQPLFKPDDIMYWRKPYAPKNTTNKMSSTCEWIIIEKHGDVYNGDLFWANYSKEFTDVLIDKPIHPFQKPESLLERLILIFSKKGDIVFDPFSGIGTMQEPCIKRGRSYVGCEIESKWF